MAAATILNCYFSNPGPPTKSRLSPEVCVLIIFQSHYYFPRYGHLKILQIWLKTPIPAPSTCVLGVLTRFYSASA